MPRKLIAGINDLQSQHPEIARQAYGWDPSKCAVGSNKKLQWICKFNHVWLATPNARTGRGFGCPYCSGRLAIKGENDLATVMPWLAAEAYGWDPSTVKIGSSANKLPWKCKQGHIFEAKVKDRALGGTGCPDCAEYGYKQSRPAWIYLLDQNEKQKIGITNSWKTRFARHRQFKWQIVQLIGIIDGSLAYEIEFTIKQWLKQNKYPIPGTTETWLKTDLQVHSILDLALRAGLDGQPLQQLIWVSPDGHIITPQGETPMAGKPPITAAIDLTADTLNALKAAGPNERGNYSLDVAVWENTRKTSDRAPGYTGTVKVKGQKDSPKSYASVWDNRGGSDDLF